MPKPSHRDALLSAGLQAMFEKGYVGATVREIATRAGAPHGSFTNHFKSKEAFASEVLSAYFVHVHTLMDVAASEPGLTPRERIAFYLDLVTDRLAADAFRRGCLIGDLSTEAPGHSELLREQLVATYAEWTDRFASWIAEAQAACEISDHFDATTLADFLLTGWEGAILRMKVEKTADPLDRFRSVVFTSLFKEI